jgi:mRNA interferase MazF
MSQTPNRGEIGLANLDPKRGTEPGKTRPVLVVQAQALLDANHSSMLVVPLTMPNRFASACSRPVVSGATRTS